MIPRMKSWFRNPNRIAWPVFLGLAGAISASAQDAAAPLPPIVRGPYLQLAAPNSIWVGWRTDWTNIIPVVRFGKTPAELPFAVAGKAILIKASLATNSTTNLERVLPLRTKQNLKLPALKGAPSGTFQYEAPIAGLLPDTKYYYAVYDGERRLTPPDESYHFKTLPPAGAKKPLRLWAIGDTGTARPAQYQVLDAMLNYTRAQNKPVDLILHMGDIAYWNGRDLELQTRHFKVYEPILRNLVMWPTYSNHDSYSADSVKATGPYFDAFIMPKNAEAGGVPSKRENYFSFDVGRVHFISLDSMEFRHRNRPEQLNWLKADLKQAKTRADWIIAYCHHTPYTKGNHNSDKENECIEMRTQYMPVLEAGGVDVVLNGHSHIYERSMLIDGAYSTNTVSDNCVLDEGDGNPLGDGAYQKSPGINPREGTVVVVLGNGGIKMTRQAVMPVMAVTFVEYGSVLVEVEGDTLTGYSLNRYGAVNDLWRIEKKEKVTPIRLPAPWQLPDWPKLGWNTDEELNIMPPVKQRQVIAPNADWQYLAGGKHPKGRAWTKPGFDAKDWKTGPAPFGYNYDQVRTPLKDMKNKYTAVYARKEFILDTIDRFTNLGLVIDYDDGFIACLNGRELARRNIGRGSGANVQSVKTHHAAGPEWVELRDFEKYLNIGKNVLTIEAHNVKADSSGFLFDPSLVAEE
jgi:hypothetical protein